MDSPSTTLNPSLFLPPLSQLSNASATRIEAALLQLQDLYWPGVSLPQKPLLNRVVQRLVHDLSVPDSGYASAEEDDVDQENNLEAIRLDPFERNFSVRWLTGFVCRSDVWSTLCDDKETELRGIVVDCAANTLARFSSRETDDQDQESLSLTRLFKFDAQDRSVIQVELNDAPLSNSDHTSVGLQSWASSIVLAERMCSSPGSFGLRTIPGQTLNVLELGAGTGLLSLAVAQLLPLNSARIVATDFHPDVLANLRRNVDTNIPRSSSSIEVQKLDWEDRDSSPLCKERVKFDVILAADVIYDPEHAVWISYCLEELLSPTGLFSLVIPIRSTGRHEGLQKTVDEAFSQSPSLTTLHTEEIDRKSAVGRADEAGYRFFQVGFHGVH